MATVDQWDSQEGYISQGQVIGFVELGTAAVAGEPLGFGTPAANKIVMDLYTGEANGVGVCLKSGGTGDKVPVCFYGVCKMLAFSVCTVGGFVISAGTPGTTITYGAVTPLTAEAGTTVYTMQGMQLARNNGTGTAFLLGQCLQAGTTVGNQLLVLIGSGH